MLAEVLARGARPKREALPSKLDGEHHGFEIAPAQ
jgi:hypothetical protein